MVCISRVGVYALLLACQCQQAIGVRRHSVRKVKAQGEPADTPGAPASCANGWLLAIMRGVVDAALRSALTNMDPANVSIHAGQYEIPLGNCTVGLEMDTTMAVSGFGGARVDQLACVDETCVEQGPFGCKVVHYTLNSSVLFGEMIHAIGSSVADVNMCGRDLPNGEVTMGFDSANPGSLATFVIQKEGWANYTIKSVTGLESVWGVLQNFRCGFSSLPNFIGLGLESWCPKIIESVAKQAETHLKGPIDALLLQLVNSLLDVPADEEQE